jgi:PhzF family phenazine biosynthesis protein
MQFYQVDIFTPVAGGGNPLGVVIGAQAWSDQQMQAFAAWTNLVETTFLLPATHAAASYRLRIFTPHREIAFAGHPSIGSAHVALESGFASARDGRLVQECLSGNLPIEQDGHALFVQAPAARVLGGGSDIRLYQLLDGLALGPLPPVLVEGGRRWWMAELSDVAALRAWQPDHAGIAALARATDALGLCVFARSNDPAFELVVRAFPGGVGIIEDPASGAANGLIAAYIASAEPNGTLARGYRVSQGREIGRDARIAVRIAADGVWVGGETRTVISGALRWDPATI